jgi:alkylation response protein AidB-like acyl-CoA dehydrogenase
MPQPTFDAEQTADLSVGYALLRAQEPLPPYEFDPQFDDPVVRQRIGDLIARPMVLGGLVTERQNRGVNWAADRVKANRPFPMR